MVATIPRDTSAAPSAHALHRLATVLLDTLIAIHDEQPLTAGALTVIGDSLTEIRTILGGEE